MRTKGIRPARLAGGVLALMLGMAIAAPAGAQDAGTVKIAVNAWVGYESNYGVVANLLQNELGYTVERLDIDEYLAWQGFETGEVDVILEVWGHQPDRETYIDQRGVAQDAGLMGVTGIIGWFVPGWMVTEHPDITSWENLNNYAELFRTSESGDKGQFLGGDPTYVSNDAALIGNLGLNFQLVNSGSEAALIESFRQATVQKTPLLGYFYDPQWAWSQSPLLEEPLVRVNLPPYTEGCDADAAAVACDYPVYPLYKAVSTTFAENGGPAYDLIRNFSWSNLDQNTVSSYISNDGMSVEDAAQKWIDENPDIWQGWLSGEPNPSGVAPSPATSQ
jgi:glycine betaine/proline transport system substrate-binding protein